MFHCLIVLWFWVSCNKFQRAFFGGFLSSQFFERMKYCACACIWSTMEYQTAFILTMLLGCFVIKLRISSSSFSAVEMVSTWIHWWSHFLCGKKANNSLESEHTQSVSMQWMKHQWHNHRHWISMKWIPFLSMRKIGLIFGIRCHHIQLDGSTQKQKFRIEGCNTVYRVYILNSSMICPWHLILNWIHPVLFRMTPYRPLANIWYWNVFGNSVMKSKSDILCKACFSATLWLQTSGGQEKWSADKNIL